MDIFLNVGDSFRLTDEMKVYADVLIYGNTSEFGGTFSFDCDENGPVRSGNVKKTLNHIVRPIGDYAYLLGDYVVTRTVVTGGGTCHGPHDVYPDGYMVEATKIGSDEKISFYQSGCFTAVNKNVEVSV